MKKTAALLLVLTLLLSCMAVFTACGSSDKDSDKTKESEKTTTKVPSKDDDEDDDKEEDTKKPTLIVDGNGNGGGGGGGSSEDEVADEWDGSVNTAWYKEDEDSFVLSTAEELAGFAKIVNETENAKTINITLGANIDLKGMEWTPIGTDEDCEVYGTFDGAGHTISNMKITSAVQSQYVGLFGYCYQNIKDLYVENISINVTRNMIIYAGGLAGYADDAPTLTSISKCYTTGTISASSIMPVCVGGLVGTSSVTISKCYSLVDVTATITANAATSEVKACAGGLVGTISGGSASVTQCYATGAVQATSVDGDATAGGLVGTGGHISTSYATGTVRAICGDTSSGSKGYAGGLVGGAATVDTGCLRVVGQVTSSDSVENLHGTPKNPADITKKETCGLTIFWDDTAWNVPAIGHPTLKYTPAAS